MTSTAHSPAHSAPRGSARSLHPYPVPRRLTPDLARVMDYWRGLLRGAAEMPFADDANLTDLPDLRSRIFLMDVFERPQRFRFAIVGHALAPADGLAGAFVDDIQPPRPFEFLASQCAATVECHEPTLYRHEGGHPYSRLLLPMWGDGRTAAILGAFDRA